MRVGGLACQVVRAGTDHSPAEVHLKVHLYGDDAEPNPLYVLRAFRTLLNLLFFVVCSLATDTGRQNRLPTWMRNRLMEAWTTFHLFSIQLAHRETCRQSMRVTAAFRSCGARGFVDLMVCR